MRPRAEEVPEHWRTEPRADLGDLGALVEDPNLDDACLRLAGLVRRLTHEELHCCWLGRVQFRARTGWAATTLDRHRRHLRREGLLEERTRRGQTTLRRLNPERVAERARQVQARRDDPGVESTGPANRRSPRNDGGGRQRNDRTPPPSIRCPEGGSSREEVREAGPPPSPRRIAGSPGEVSPDAPADEGEAAPEPEGASRNGDGPRDWHRRVGAHPETGREIRAGRNRYGPYVAHLHPNDQEESVWRPLPDQPTRPFLEELTVEKALEFLAFSRRESRLARGLVDTYGRGQGERDEHARPIEEKIPVVGDSPPAGEEAPDG